MPASASSTTAAPTAVLISEALSCFLTAPSSSLTAPSPRGAVIGGGTLLPQGIEVTGGDRGADLVDQAHHEALVVDGAQGRGQHLLGPEQVDRKSTRLNSSHVAISYAVFCLKKKKKRIRIR